MSNLVPLAIADLELQLASAIAIGATAFTLSSAVDDDGIALPAGKYCFTVDNGSAAKEYLMGQVNGTAVTSVVSVSRQGVETSGAVRAHRVGASCIVSDFAVLQRVADILRGILALDGSSPIAYDAEPTLTDRKQLATYGKLLDLVLGGAVTFDNQIITGILAGETIVSGDSVYLKESDQRWWKADADLVATIDNVQHGIALGAGSAGVAITGGVLLQGVYTTSGLTAGQRYYIGNTAGARTTTAGTVSLPVGFAYSTTKLLFFPRHMNIPTTAQKNALEAAVNTPGTTNPFKTTNKAMTAGATITGATLPVPVYQDTTSFKYLACIGNDTTKIKFQGFATSNSTDGNPINVQFDGIVAGFTGLTRGVKYYLDNTSGLISSTPGTYEVYVGIAISTTEILIQKGKRFSCGVTTFASSTTTALVTGFKPSKIYVHAHVASASASVDNVSSDGGWTLAGGNACVYLNKDNSNISGSGNTASEAWHAETDTSSSKHVGTITSITDNGFTLSNTKSGSPATVQIFWEAEGEF